MPYITQDRRAAIQSGAKPTTAGELNFKITTILIQQTDVSTGLALAEGEAAVLGAITGYLQFPINYARCNEIVGAISCAALEFGRRVQDPSRRTAAGEICHRAMARFYTQLVAPYEDIKIKENGDCYV